MTASINLDRRLFSPEEITRLDLFTSMLDTLYKDEDMCITTADDELPLIQKIWSEVMPRGMFSSSVIAMLREWHLEFSDYAGILDSLDPNAKWYTIRTKEMPIIDDEVNVDIVVTATPDRTCGHSVVKLVTTTTVEKGDAGVIHKVFTDPVIWVLINRFHQ